jgi:hypothetical protein
MTAKTERSAVTGPRNRQAFERGRELHGLIHSIVRLTQCPHCGDPPSTKAVRGYLPEDFQHRDLRTISAHVRRVVEELQRAEE